MSGTTDRKERILNPKNGTWGSSSQDLLHLVNVLLCYSKDYAERFDGNVSIYALAGIPTLFSAFRALLVESNGSMYGEGSDTDCIKDLNAMNEYKFLKKYYDVSEELLNELLLAYEIRNEIAHPSHMPTGTESGTPEYLITLRDRGLLQDGIWISQMESHKLFIWVAEIFEKIARIVLEKHYATKKQMESHALSWSRYNAYML